MQGLARHSQGPKLTCHLFLFNLQAKNGFTLLSVWGKKIKRIMNP